MGKNDINSSKIPNYPVSYDYYTKPRVTENFASTPDETPFQETINTLLSDKNYVMLGGVIVVLIIIILFMLLSCGGGGGGSRRRRRRDDD